MVMNNGHEAYQVKGNEAYNNMLANIFPLLWPLGVGSKVFFFSFYESSHIAYQINGNEA